MLREKSHIETFSCYIFGSFWDMFTLKIELPVSGRFAVVSSLSNEMI